MGCYLSANHHEPTPVPEPVPTVVTPHPAPSNPDDVRCQFYTVEIMTPVPEPVPTVVTPHPAPSNPDDVRCQFYTVEIMTGIGRFDIIREMFMPEHDVCFNVDSSMMFDVNAFCTKKPRGGPCTDSWIPKAVADELVLYANGNDAVREQLRRSGLSERVRPLLGYPAVLKSPCWVIPQC
jgi:hypothetical protein